MTIFGHYITVEAWSIDFQLSQDSLSPLMTWVKLLGLPDTLYKRSFIEAIGNQIGPMIKVYYQTDNGYRGRFTQMVVSINLRQPLISKLIVIGRVQLIEYESFPIIYFKCGIYDHLKDIYPKLSETDHMNDMLHDVSPPPALVMEGPPLAEPFGPWMLVE
ncbi:hypothetical protein V6N13_124010 [Hibiscus sabdariffa]|uniref:Uncharacterized protein n=2 Tax=Hibiscus sabdariffa TaxID=183260 RepID=A0ABR1ZZE8_9ROSI